MSVKELFLPFLLFFCLRSVLPLCHSFVLSSSSIELPVSLNFPLKFCPQKHDDQKSNKEDHKFSKIKGKDFHRGSDSERMPQLKLGWRSLLFSVYLRNLESCLGLFWKLL